MRMILRMLLMLRLLTEIIGMMLTLTIHLILSTHVVSEDVANFEYTPKPGYPDPFHIFNARTENDISRRFLAEWQRIRP